MPLSETEARLIAIRIRVTDLLFGDEVGPSSDVTLPISYTVIGVPERTEEQRRDPMALRIRSPEGVESVLTSPASSLVWVRRYAARVQNTRGDGSVDRTTPVVLLRLVGGGVLTIVDSSALRLRAHDRLAFTAA